MGGAVGRGQWDIEYLMRFPWIRRLMTRYSSVIYACLVLQNEEEIVNFSRSSSIDMGKSLS